MDILYKNKAAKEQFSSAYRAKWRYPAKVVEKLLAAEIYIKNADSLQDIRNYPPFHFHRLVGDRKNEWSIYLGNTGYRVTLLPCGNDGSVITGGDILAQCKSIKVMMVTEVSNHYE